MYVGNSAGGHGGLRCRRRRSLWLLATTSVVMAACGADVDVMSFEGWHVPSACFCCGHVSLRCRHRWSPQWCRRALPLAVSVMPLRKHGPPQPAAFFPGPSTGCNAGPRQFHWLWRLPQRRPGLGRRRRGPGPLWWLRFDTAGPQRLGLPVCRPCWHTVQRWAPRLEVEAGRTSDHHGRTCGGMDGATR